MGRGLHKEKKEHMKVKSFRLKDSDISAIKAYQNAEGVPQSEALRMLIQYGILYYTMIQAEE